MMILHPCWSSLVEFSFGFFWLSWSEVGHNHHLHCACHDHGGWHSHGEDRHGLVGHRVPQQFLKLLILDPCFESIDISCWTIWNHQRDLLMRIYELYPYHIVMIFTLGLVSQVCCWTPCSSWGSMEKTGLLREVHSFNLHDDVFQIVPDIKKKKRSSTGIFRCLEV